jgi:hypothetical protein
LRLLANGRIRGGRVRGPCIGGVIGVVDPFDQQYGQAFEIAEA